MTIAPFPSEGQEVLAMARVLREIQIAAERLPDGDVNRAQLEEGVEVIADRLAGEPSRGYVAGLVDALLTVCRNDRIPAGQQVAMIEEILASAQRRLVRPPLRPQVDNPPRTG